MKRSLYFLVMAVAIIFTSCSSNEEELWIEADGSGRYESTMDLSGIYPFLLMGLNSESEEEEEEEEKDPFTIMMESLLQSESVDTLIDFSDIIARELQKEGKDMKMLLDSLQSIDVEEAGITEAEKEANLQMFEEISNIKLRMQIKKSESLFKITTINTFDDIAAFEQGGNFMEMMMGMNDNAAMGGQSEMIEDAVAAQTQFALSGRTLKVSRRGQDMDDMSEEDKQQMQMMEGMLGDEPYRLTIHFPGKVKKKINSKYAERVDKETVVIEIPQEDLKNPEMELDLGIKFKGLKR